MAVRVPAAAACLVWTLAAALPASAQEAYLEPPALPPADSTAPSAPVSDTAAVQDSASSAAEPAAAATEAVVVEEEDIFTELSKQGLRIDGSEESIVDRAVVEAPKASADTADSASPGATVSSGDSVQAPLPSDSAGGMTSERYRGRYGKYGPPMPESQQTQAPPDTSEAVPVGPARVDEVKAVNFARNLKQYRSPRLAILLSMVVPGLGQAYARSYWKTGLYGGLELGLIGASIGFSVAGNSKADEAYSYADDHFDVDGTEFIGYYDYLLGFFQSLYGVDTAQSEMDLIFYPKLTPDGSGGYDTLAVKDWYPIERNKRSKLFYDWAGSGPYVQGWDDCEPDYRLLVGTPGDTIHASYHSYVVHGSADSTFLVYMLSEPDDSGGQVATGRAMFGYSKNQKKYNDILADANGYKRVSTNLLVVLLVNHIASAIDAGITAKRYNDRMLGKVSAWDRIHVEQQMVSTGSDYAPGVALTLDF